MQAETECCDEGSGGWGGGSNVFSHFFGENQNEDWRFSFISILGSSPLVRSKKECSSSPFCLILCVILLWKGINRKFG